MIVNRCLRRLGLIAIAGCLATAVAQGQVVIFSNLTTPNNTGADIVGGSIPTAPASTWAATFLSNGKFNLVDVKVSVAAGVGDPTFTGFLACDDPDATHGSIHMRQVRFRRKAP